MVHVVSDSCAISVQSDERTRTTHHAFRGSGRPNRRDALSLTSRWLFDPLGVLGQSVVTLGSSPCTVSGRRTPEEGCRTLLLRRVLVASLTPVSLCRDAHEVLSPGRPFGSELPITASRCHGHDILVASTRVSRGFGESPSCVRSEN